MDTLTVTDAISAQITYEELCEFFEQHGDGQILIRREHSVTESMRNNAFFVVVDQKGQLLGTSANYEYGDTSYVELGSTALQARGFGLHGFLIRCRLLYSYTTAMNSTAFGAIGGSNGKVRDTAIRMGFNSWELPFDLKALREKKLTQRGLGHINFFRFQWEPPIYEVAAQYLNFLANPVRNHRSDQARKVKICIDHPWLSEGRVIDEIKDLAKQTIAE